MFLIVIDRTVQKILSYSSKNGVTKSIEDTFDTIGSKIGLDRLANIADGISDIADAIPAKTISDLIAVQMFLNVGPPRVDFIGSSGQGGNWISYCKRSWEYYWCCN